MYGTIAQMKLKQGRMGEIQALSERWSREHSPKARGFVGTYVFQMDNDPDECWLVALFEDRESYTANANSPEQDAWYQQVRSHLEEDPVWHDGEVIHSLVGSRPEAAM